MRQDNTHDLQLALPNHPAQAAGEKRVQEILRESVLEELTDTDLQRSAQALRDSTASRAGPLPPSRLTSAEVIDRLLALSQQHPTWGPRRLRASLAEQGIHRSELTIYHYLDAYGVRTKADRLRHLDRRVGGDPRMFASLSAEQLEGLAGFNPCYREHALIPSRPGELLAQSVIEVWPRKGMRADLATRRIPDSATSRTPGIGRVFLHVVVDTYSSYAFAVLRHKASAGSALTLLNDIVQPFFAERRLTVERIRTEDRRPFSRSKAQRYPLDLVRQGITQECTSRKQGPNGFVERFVQIAQEEFLEQALYAVDRYPSLSVLQDEFARWVTCYNTERANLGYPHGGQRPRELIAAYLASQPAAS